MGSGQVSTTGLYPQPQDSSCKIEFPEPSFRAEILPLSHIFILHL